MSATMMNHSRRFQTPNKRKERDGFDARKPSTTTTATKLAKPTVPRAATPASPKPSEPASRNLLLAGYLAHEFLTKGTLFGQPWDPARAEAMPVSRLSPAASELRRMKSSSSSQKLKAQPSVKPEGQGEMYQRYVDVAHLLKTDGAQLPGIVNPTQLTRFLRL